MDKRTLKALKESIAHWYRISACMTPEALKEEGWGGTACPLCDEFLADGCKGCPVSQKVGDTLCCGTPYSPASDSLAYFCMGRPWTEKDQEAVEDEIRFLESLLP